MDVSFALFVDLQTEITSLKWSVKWPNQKDIEGSALALSRIQAFYRLNPLDIANGQLGHIKTGARLSWKDCALLGNHRLKGKANTLAPSKGEPEYAVAIEWKEAALK